MFQRLVSYEGIVDIIAREGERSAPRGEPTTELLNVGISTSSIVLVGRKKLNVRLAILEATMMCGGIFDIEAIRAVAPNANIELYKFQSDYGPRIYEQMIHVDKTLRDDPMSRRAVVYLNNRDTPGYDCACTSSIQFLVRNQLLETIVSMRSWDIVYGFPMDVFAFGFLQQLLAASLNVGVGGLFINAGSLHLYEKTEYLAKEPKLTRMIDINDESLLDIPFEETARLCRYAVQRIVDSGTIGIDSMPFSFKYSSANNVSTIFGFTLH